MRFHWMIAAGVLLCLGGCGGGGSGSGGGGAGGSTATGGTGGSTATGGTGGSTATGGTGGSTATGALAPTMISAEPMEGALHVMWTNNTPDCDKIELDRNHDGGAYATAYTLNGAAEAQHDTQAVPPGEYCYKARCIKGAETSPDSNEVCGTP